MQADVKGTWVYEKTGDLNTDFLNQVLQYQRALIALSKNELQYGERKELKQPVDQFIDGLKLNLKKISKVQKSYNNFYLLLCLKITD